MKFHILFHFWQILLTNFFDDENLIILLSREERERGRGGSFFTRIRLGRRWIWRIEKIQPRERDTLAGFHPSPSIWYKGYQRLRNPSEKFLNPSSASRSRDKLITGIPEKSRKFILPGARVSFVKIYERTNNEKKEKKGKEGSSRRTDVPDRRSSREKESQNSETKRNGTNERTERCSKGVSFVNRSVMRDCSI